MNAFDFASMLGGFIPTPQLIVAGQTTAPQESPKVPPTNPEVQAALIKDVQEDLGVQKVYEPAGKDAERLNQTMNKIYAATFSGAVPSASNLPPKTKIVLFDDGPYNAESAYTVKNDASVIVMSSKLLHDASDTDLNALLAHEYSHPLINTNPDMLKNYNPPNPDSVTKDFRNMGFQDSGGPIDKTYVKYKTEMLADKVAVQITRDPESFKAFIGKFGAATDMPDKKTLEEATRSALADASKELGRPLTDDEQNYVKKTTSMQSFLDSPHPSTATRIEATDIDARQKEKQAPDQNKDILQPDNVTPTTPLTTPLRPPSLSQSDLPPR